MTESAAPVDEQLLLRTPEGVALGLVPAGPVPRLFAHLIDLLLAVFTLLVLFLLSLLTVSSTVMNVSALLSLFLMLWVVPVLFEVGWNGQTPGKRLMGLRVVMEDGLPLTWTAGFLRNLVRVVDLLPFGYLVGFLSCLITPRMQRLGDLTAGTLVIHAAAPSIPAPCEPAPSALVPDWPLDLEDRRTLVAVLARAPGLNRERLNELARLAFPELEPAQAGERLLALSRQVHGA